MDGAGAAPAHAVYPFMSQEDANSPAKLAGYCVRLVIPRQYGGGPLVVRSTRAQPLLDLNHPHTVVVAVSNVDVPLRIHVTSMWPVQSGSDRWPSVASTTPASSSDGRDHTSHRVN